MSRKGKVFLVSTAILIGVLVPGMVIYTLSVRNLLENELLNSLPPGSSVEHLTFNPFRSLVTVTGLHIPNPAGYSRRDAVTVQRITADLNAPALCRHVIYFEKLEITDITVCVELLGTPASLLHWEEMVPRLLLTDSGVNLLNLLRKIEEKCPKNSGAAASEKAAAEPWKLRIDKLHIGQSSICSGNLMNAVELVNNTIEQFLRLMPDNYRNVPLVLKAADIFRGTLRGKLEEYSRQPLLFSKNDYDDLGQDERTSFAGVVCEIAGKHAYWCRDECRKCWRSFSKLLEEQKACFLMIVDVLKKLPDLRFGKNPPPLPEPPDAPEEAAQPPADGKSPAAGVPAAPAESPVL